MKLTFLIGISGSGKSTFAKSLLEANPDAITVNRDLLRLSLVRNLKGYYQRKNIVALEGIVTQCSNEIISGAARKKLDIIIDNTNLDNTYINNIIGNVFRVNQEYEIHYYHFPINPIDARKRVMQRDGLSFEETEYILNQHKKEKELIYISSPVFKRTGTFNIVNQK